MITQRLTKQTSWVIKSHERRCWRLASTQAFQDVRSIFWKNELHTFVIIWRTKQTKLPKQNEKIHIYIHKGSIPHLLQRLTEEIACKRNFIKRMPWVICYWLVWQDMSGTLFFTEHHVFVSLSLNMTQKKETEC